MGGRTAARTGWRGEEELQPVARASRRSRRNSYSSNTSWPRCRRKGRCSIRLLARRKVAPTVPGGRAAHSVETISLASGEDDDTGRFFRPESRFAAATDCVVPSGFYWFAGFLFLHCIHCLLTGLRFTHCSECKAYQSDRFFFSVVMTRHSCPWGQVY